MKGEPIVKIQITSTNKYAELDGVLVRLWEGITEGGARCLVYVHRIAVAEGQDQEEFDRELEEKLAPHQTTHAAVISLKQII
jgi:hypothetical protein